jgi:RNA polymerase sigma-70 factor, ECF subfamily
MMGTVSAVAEPRGGSGVPRGLDLSEDAEPDMPASPGLPRLTARAEARLRKMVDAHFDFVWRSLRGLGVPAATADDSAQQVFWIAAQKLDAIVAGSERSFLFATARGIAANVRRGRARSREVQDEAALAVQVDAGPNPEQLAASAEARVLLDTFLEALPDDLRTVFVLFELEGMSMVDMAEVLDLPAGTVASRLRRAREAFQAAAKRFHAKGDRS